MTTTESNTPICLCAEVYPGQGHHPECPVLHRIESLTAQLKTAREALENLTGPNADRLAADMDHSNKDHSKWWRDVKRARVVLAQLTPTETKD